MITTEVEPFKTGNARIEKNYLIIEEDTPLREWKDIGKKLSSMQGNIQFWIGDWVRFGNKKGYYTDSKTYDEIVEITGFERSTIQDYKYVCENTSSVRNEDLSFSHHKVIANLKEDQQIYFLNKALQEKLSVAELRLHVMHETQSQGRSENATYNNYNPFPLRLGELHLKLQQEAFEMKTTIHNRALQILKEHFERKEKALDN